MCNPLYNRRVTNKKTMFDSQLKPYFGGAVLANETAMADPVVIAALKSLEKRNFEPKELTTMGYGTSQTGTNHVYTKRNRITYLH